MRSKKYRIFIVLLSALLIVLLTFFITLNPKKADAAVDSSMASYISTEAERSSLDLTASRTSETAGEPETTPAEESATAEVQTDPSDITGTVESAPESEAASDTQATADTEAPTEITTSAPAEGVTVLVGDSRTNSFEFYGLYPDDLVFSYMDQVDVHYSELDQAARLHPAKIIFLNGIDDLICWNTAQETIGHYEAYISYFQSISPDTTIYVHTVLPVTEAACQRFPQLREISAYNELLADMCARHGWNCINCATNFDLSYYGSTGDGIHFSKTWAEIWLAQMRSSIGF